MRIQDSLWAARESLRHGKTRSLLTMLGIVIGIASVIVLMSIGQSAQALILSQVQGLGSNLIFIIPGGSASGRFSSPASAQGIVVTSLKQSDIDALKREPSFTDVSAEVRGQAHAVYEDNDVTVTYDGILANFFAMRNFGITDGYAFTNDDVNSFNHVAVIGSALAKTLFGSLEPVGKMIRLGNTSLRIVGVLEAKGTGAFGVDQDNLVLVPVTVAQKQMLGINYFNDIFVEANDAYTIDFAKARVQNILEQDHNITDPNKDDFTVRTQQDALSLLGNITSILTLFLTAIASISLIVGGIGIMNIMLVSVIERTREIGLRKAVGATDGDVLQQFLIEAVLVTLVGGVIGVALGAVVVTIAYFVIANFFSVAGWSFQFPLSAVLISLGVAAATGVVFGIYPARQAARRSPIDALRYE